MGWQADHGPWPGGASGQDEGLPELLAGFGHGGAWEAAVPSAALAAALEAAAGPDGLYAGADADALTGIVRQWAAVESWAAAGLLAALRAMMREDTEGRPLPCRHAGLPEGWDDSLNYEVAAALAMGPVSAGNLAHLAWALGTRLPGIGRLLADGTLTRAKAKLIAQLFEPLDDGEAVRAEALILGEVAGKTYFQVQRLAWRAALAVAPDAAERRLGTRPRNHEERGRHMDTDPARRQGTDRAARHRPHPRVRPPVSSRLLPAQRPAPPPGPGPRSRMHVPNLFPARSQLGLRARRPLRSGRTNRCLQCGRPQPPMSPG